MGTWLAIVKSDRKNSRRSHVMSPSSHRKFPKKMYATVGIIFSGQIWLQYTENGRGNVSTMGQTKCKCSSSPRWTHLSQLSDLWRSAICVCNVWNRLQCTQIRWVNVKWSIHSHVAIWHDLYVHVVCLNGWTIHHLVCCACGVGTLSGRVRHQYSTRLAWLCIQTSPV